MARKSEHRLHWADQHSSNWFSRFLKHLIRDTRAQDQIEYAVCIGTIALVAALAIPAIADGVSSVLLNTQNVLGGAPASSNSNNGNGSNNGNCGNPNPGSFKGRSPCAP